MSDEQGTDPTREVPADGAESGAEKSAEKSGEKKDGGRNDIVDAVIGLAVLGLGAAVVSGSASLGGVLRGLTRGTPPRTPPIAPM